MQVNSELEITLTDFSWRFFFWGVLQRKLGFPGSTSDKKHNCQCRRHERRGFSPWVAKIPWRRAWQPTLVFLLGNPWTERAWWATVHRVAKSRTWLEQLSIAQRKLEFYPKTKYSEKNNHYYHIPTANIINPRAQTQSGLKVSSYSTWSIAEDKWAFCVTKANLGPIFPEIWWKVSFSHFNIIFCQKYT